MTTFPEIAGPIRTSPCTLPAITSSIRVSAASRPAAVRVKK
ncbi:hypothetical protein [Candidatus Palauibacter sp.]